MFPEEPLQTETEPTIKDVSPFPGKANLLNRCLAKFIDLLVVAAFYEIPLQVSFLVGLVYLSLADGFQGRSLGKRMIGLTVMRSDDGLSPASFRESIIRNVPFAAAYFLYHVPFIGWLIALGIIGFEFFLILGHLQGLRCGDELAHTCVLDKGAEGRGVSSSALFQNAAIK